MVFAILLIPPQVIGLPLEGSPPSPVGTAVHCLLCIPLCAVVVVVVVVAIVDGVSSTVTPLLTLVPLLLLVLLLRLLLFAVCASRRIGR